MFHRYDESVLIQNMFSGSVLPETQNKIAKKKCSKSRYFSCGFTRIILKIKYLCLSTPSTANILNSLVSRWKQSFERHMACIVALGRILSKKLFYKGVPHVIFQATSMLAIRSSILLISTPLFIVKERCLIYNAIIS